ncbi:MAG: hypothetical protein ACK5G7_01730 [Erysipelotrichaceae bacterium]
MSAELEGYKTRSSELEDKLSQEKTAPVSSAHLELLKRLSRLEQKVYGRE